MMRAETRQSKRYHDWYSFKNDLETRLGRGVPVKVWLRTKPKTDPPWVESDMQSTVVEAMKILKNESGADSGYIFGGLR
jgi:hypothetical protein